MAHGHDSKEKVVYVGDSRVRKRNAMIPPDYSAYPGKSEAFVPNFLLKEWMVGAVVLVGVLVLVMQEPAPLGYPADPLNTGFIPMPDWYFLFLYQFLKYPYVSGNTFKIFMGSIVFPGIFFGALMLAPFLDTGKERRFYKRPIASSLMFLSLIACIHLTVVSWMHYQKELTDKNIIPEHIKREQEAEAAKKAGGEGGGAQKPAGAAQIVAQDDPGYQIYQKATCVSCHAKDLKGVSGMPALRGIGDKHSKEEILNIIKNGKPPGMTAQYDANIQKGLSAADIDTLADWLAKQKKQ
ncbi:c-type cytochrome [Paenibacillus flagellatus]|uniref:Menaquinol-cytochrome C reductase n=1 Tax=Paenibacillus flagellatus TaxID=2211139 RepID=A0A2V5KT84_9BACL|nr:cytochrome c [Paenibacillus flagellatus]PYI54897.1 menaquinol-cytochrome C reductase [Paenibacillus flagellatus]